MSRLEVAAFEPIKGKYEWIINQTKTTQELHEFSEFPTNDINLTSRIIHSSVTRLKLAITTSGMLIKQWISFYDARAWNYHFALLAT